MDCPIDVSLTKWVDEDAHVRSPCGSCLLGLLVPAEAVKGYRCRVDFSNVPQSSVSCCLTCFDILFSGVYTIGVVLSSWRTDLFIIV